MHAIVKTSTKTGPIIGTKLRRVLLIYCVKLNWGLRGGSKWNCVAKKGNVWSSLVFILKVSSDEKRKSGFEVAGAIGQKGCLSPG